MKDILEKAKEYSEDEELVRVLDYEKMRDELQEITKEESFEEGSYEKARIIAKNMLDMSIDINTISKATGLTIEEINKLL